MDNIAMMRAFVAVAEEQSFVAAARRLRTTPQLVSKYVQMLEADIGVALLHRTTRQVSKTEVGAAYFERCVVLLEDFDDMRESAKDAHSQPKGLLRLAAPVTFAELYLADVLKEFSDAYPEIRINLQLSDDYVDLFAENIDVAIRIGELDDSTLIARRIMTTGSILCASPEYLAREGTPKTGMDLLNHHCLVDTNSRMGDRWIPSTEEGQRSIQVPSTISVNSATVAIELAKLGAGIIQCPCIFVQKEIEQGSLVQLDLDWRNNPFGVFALFHKSERTAAKVRVFVDFIASKLGEKILDERS